MHGLREILDYPHYMHRNLLTCENFKVLSLAQDKPGFQVAYTQLVCIIPSYNIYLQNFYL